MPRCSAGLCGAPAELEAGGATHHPRLHVPLCLGHRSLFVERGKRGWPMDAEVRLGLGLGLGLSLFLTLTLTLSLTLTLTLTLTRGCTTAASGAAAR